MSVAFLDLSRQLRSERDELERAIRDVLDSASFVLGPPVERFEAAFALFCGARHAVGVASGTDAITIALGALGVGTGDEVIAPAYTCVPTVAAIEAAGATPVLVDVDAETFTIDPARVHDAVGERTRAVVAVHLYGQCADVATLAEVARDRGLVVVEDAAQAHGAARDGRRAGTLGDAAAFSFYPTKNLGALGDGGAVVTDDPVVADRARMLRAYGERARYDSVLRGRNSRLDALQAAVLTVRLPRVDERNDRRRRLAALYREALTGLELELPREAPGSTHVYHLFVIRARERDALRERLAASGIATLVHYPRPIHEHPAYADLGRGRDLRRSERLSREVLSLPLYPELTDSELERVAGAVRDALAAVPA